MTATSFARHTWIEKVHTALRVKFADCGYAVPIEVRVSIGFPKGSRAGNGKIGQCWAPAASTDRYTEIFVSPELRDGARIMDVLAHELAHATVGCEAGHKAPFKRCATDIGLTGKMTATVATREFSAWARKVMAKIGPYPAGALSSATRKKQSTRMIKCECGACGYTVRTTNKWLDIAVPTCPVDEIEMFCDSPEGE